ncbi:MAG: 50S ribosomal protein L23, partial [Candidatus Methanomethylophilaceae archaeon]|nr:50S ribosomal protein L23 [Candidatus Methanomethylophilaceae archaeon]
MKQSDILIRPFVTEKSLNFLSGTPKQKFKDGNKIEFIVHRDASKIDVKVAFEERFEVKVDQVWTRIQKDG